MVKAECSSRTRKGEIKPVDRVFAVQGPKWICTFGVGPAGPFTIVGRAVTSGSFTHLHVRCSTMHPHGAYVLMI